MDLLKNLKEIFVVLKDGGGVEGVVQGTFHTIL